uniref:SCO-spondin-like isoform X1 n=1 Tax=Styela clava TaxID=7725 RepID=UPI00193944D9|nr:SCO-spondin-like isoform X1 [Styela clava]
MADTSRHSVSFVLLLSFLVISNAQVLPPGDAVLSGGTVTITGSQSGGVITGGVTTGGVTTGGVTTGGVVSGQSGFQVSGTSNSIQIPPLRVDEIANVGDFVNRQDYQGAPVYWGNYGLWTNCRGTCGLGYRLRQRVCFATVTSVEGRIVVSQSNQQFVQSGVVGNTGILAGATGEVISTGGGIPIGQSPANDASVLYQTGGVIQGGGQYQAGGAIQTGGVIQSSGQVVTSSQQYTGDIFGQVPQISPQYNTGCVGTLVQAEGCALQPCVVIGRWTRWTVWTICSAQCGGGVQSRSRSCEGGTTCPPGSPSETRSCNIQPCVGIWGVWQVWGGCSLNCGGGTQTRFRTCSTDNCVGLSAETRSCNIQPCQGRWGVWGVYDACTAQCGGGTRTRVRICIGEQNCVGPPSETIVCNPQPCYGTYGAWGEWSICTKDCGGGTRTSIRICVGAATCIGPSSKTETCNPQDCITYRWGAWREWGGCSASCGEGTYTRSRPCMYGSTVSEDSQCESLYGGNSFQTNTCFAKPCLSFNIWTSWSGCFPACGPGTETRTRQCLSNGSPTSVPGACNSIGEISQSRDCTRGPCWAYGPWESWGSCSQDCGQGIIQRFRGCLSNGNPYAIQSGLTCGTLTVFSESKPCLIQSCFSWRQWSDWTPCRPKCGPGESTRARVCVADGVRTTAPNQCRNIENGKALERKSCSDGPCYGWARWQRWTECSTPCGRGQSNRVRDCLENGQISASNDGCMRQGGQSVQTKDCFGPPCYRWGIWTDWTICSRTCGLGETERNRECTSLLPGPVPPGSCDSLDDFGAIQVQKCTQGPCYVWERWTDWTPCSRDCGPGQITRNRRCLADGQPVNDRNLCRDIDGGQSFQSQPCQIEKCYRWSIWTRWAECSKDCGGGETTRSRRCVADDNTDGPFDKCEGGFYDGQAPNFQTRICNPEPCFRWSIWTEWSVCPVSCGIGTVSRSRGCVADGVDAPSYASCAPDIHGSDSVQTQQCEREQCYGWDRWSEWGDCSAACGSGRVSRSRRCIGLSDGLAVSSIKCDGSGFETKPCFLRKCYQWMEWTDWSICSSLCGLGSSTRNRRCVTVEGNEDAPSYDLCGSELSFESRPCQIDKCYRWLRWTDWTNCPVSCGTGQVTRNRRCVDDEGVEAQPTKCKADEYDLKTFEVRSCNPGPCFRWARWTEWTTCSAKCGLGVETRSRRCVTVGGDQDAPSSTVCGDGNAFDSRPCQIDKCYRWSRWTDWTPCPVSCGIGQISRNRRCIDDDGQDGQPEKCKVDQYDDIRTFDVQTCDQGPCFRWERWTEWTTCSAKCGLGVETRSRRCVTVGGDQDAPSSTVCGDGNAFDSRPCQIDKCYRWSRWTDWTTCPVSCGTGQISRNRRCIDDEGQEGSPEKCKADQYDTNTFDVQTCDRGPCYTLSLWSDWSKCTRSCGEGIRTRSKSCQTIGGRRVSDSFCTDLLGERFETQDCNLGDCHRFTDWGSWTACSVPCGSGEQQKRRRCETVSGIQASDSQCSTDRRDFFITIKCFKDDCPGSWRQWGEWSRCSATCNSGSQARVRFCSAKKCFGRSRETRVCNDVECIPIEDSGSWSSWSSWSSCGGRCGVSEQTRICVGGTTCGGEEHRRTRECCPTDDGQTYVTGGSSGGVITTGGSGSSGGVVITGGSGSSGGAFITGGSGSSGGAVITGGGSVSGGGVVITGGSSGGFSTTTTTISCTGIGDRRDCGFEGITQSECMALSCCWDNSIPNVPWCFVPDEAIITEGGTGGGGGGGFLTSGGGFVSTGGGSSTVTSSSSGSLSVVTDGSGTTSTLTQTGTDGVTTIDTFDGNIGLDGLLSEEELRKLGINIPFSQGPVGDMMKDKNN